ncbi:hypothetical protein RHMOL_Rhmol08G0012100 [Rhododendron molle]|uniref:Uncharacterized protein n=3 Tax=Rhododendron molle TaxID=49168 RepID=A0ACC0MKB4_RHOML|nr:hypothetical protein RHMOL_Rhmol08G0012100 [Rhododendron molle]KAI8540788.1 hypothetical protein RHMOL_Rhmol08G0012100 [Rhododendron molle]KAI8540789.1 hypothetical protein RHMOL_Rhmol08G0012100 [Rhododendron molle]
MPANIITHHSSFGPSRRFHCSSVLRSAKRITIPPQLPEKTPSSHSWRRYIIPTALLGGIGGVVFLFHSNDERRAILKGQGADCDRCTIKGPIIGGPFTLMDTEGQLVTQNNLRGNWVLLYFGYTSSPDVGPAEVHKMAKATDILVTAVRQIAHEYRVFFKKVEEDGDDYLVESSHNMYLVNPNMEVVRCFGVEYNAEELSEAILKEVNRTGTLQTQSQ